MADVRPLPVNPEEAIAFFRAKGFDLKPSWHWTDFRAEQHSHAFTVAKSAGYDILADIHAAVESAIAEGKTLDWFRKQLTPVLQEKGWWGKKEVMDPETGETTEVQLGSPRRLRVIFQTNLRMAYMAGKWQRIVRTARHAPWLRYVTAGDNHVRMSHRHWQGTILRFDDPWWNTHYPPNDFGCRCDVQQLSDRDMARFGFTPTKNPPRALKRTWINRRTGSTESVEEGIKPGFDHHVGKIAQAQHAGRVLMERLAGMPPELAAQASKASAAFAVAGVLADFAKFIGTVTSEGYRVIGALRVAGTLSPDVLAELKGRGVLPQSAAIAITDRAILHMLRDAKPASQKIDLGQLVALPLYLQRPIAVLLQRDNGRLLYVFSVASNSGRGKVIVAVDHIAKLPGGERQTAMLNQIVTVSVVDRVNLTVSAGYDLIAGSV